MVLNVFFNKSWHHVETRDEMALVISELTGSDQMGVHGGTRSGSGVDAWLGFSDLRIEGAAVPDPFLRIGLNRETGYGGLVWGVTDTFPERLGVWVSDNADPPSFDPCVISDPGVPVFYEPRSTVSSYLVRAALEEFCYTGTGVRPTCIGWVPGHINGKRLDSTLCVEMVESVDPWA